MPSNITQIPAPRVPVIDAKTGLMSREWYRFFINLFTLTGDGSNTASLTDLQVGPPSSLDSLVIDQTYADLAPPAIPDQPAGSSAQVQYNNDGVFGASPSFTWSPTTFTVGPAGGTVIVNTVAPTSSQSAALLRFNGRNAAQANGNGGGFTFSGGTALGTGSGGGFTFSGGVSPSSQGGGISFISGTGTTNLGGDISFTSGSGGVQGGNFSYAAGAGIGINGNGGTFSMTAGDAKGSGAGGTFLLTAGTNVDVVGPGGDFYLLAGGGGTTGSIYLQAQVGTVIQITDDTAVGQLGFFGAAPVAQPTAVPVTAAGIHAALVSLGLIT